MATLEELDHISHIHHRPDMYIGTTRSTSSKEWIVRPDDTRMSYNDVSINKGLVRLVVEVLSNAIDHCWRSQQQNIQPKKIRIDMDDHSIAITNDGIGIPLEFYKDTGTYIPEVAFGRLLTSTNYNDDEERMTSGRNGLGVKLSNVFSQRFEIHIVSNTQKYVQIWQDHMRTCHPPRLTTLKKAAPINHVRVTFFPDFSLFGLSSFTPDHIDLVRKLCLDTAMITQLPITFNTHTFRLKSCLDYVKLFPFYTRSECMTLVDTPHLHVIVCASPDKEHKDIVFTNGVYNKDGSVIADALLQELGRVLCRLLQTKLKTPTLTLRDIKPHISLFVRAHVSNPEFNNQSKDRMIAPVPARLSFEITTVASMMKWSFVAHLREQLVQKDVKSMKSLEKTKVNIDGYDPANLAGTSRSSDCTLIVCEGLSAKSFAVKGIEVGWNGRKGRDYFGILPLRGKPLNVRNVSLPTVMKNKEVMDIAHVLNLRSGHQYDDTLHGLTYGKLLLLTDADSVTEDTPLYVRHRISRKISVRTIDELSNEPWIDFREKQHQVDIPYDIWTERGWTSIDRVIRHKTRKRIYRVATGSGIVDVTEDHSLLTPRGQVVSPKDLCLGQSLMHSFPDLSENNNETTHASCLYEPHDIYTQAIAAMYTCTTKVYPCDNKSAATFFTLQHNDTWTRLLTPHIPPSDACRDERDRLRVPEWLFRACMQCRRQYLNGLSLFVPQKDTFRITLRTPTKLFSQDVYVLATSCAYFVTMTHDSRRDACALYTLVLSTSAPLTKDVHKVYRIQYMETSSRYVYDVQTSNHHFQAGVGNMIVHNTDGIHIASLLLNLFDVLYPTLVRHPSFLNLMMTPIARVNTKVFYDEHEYRRSTHTKGKTKVVAQYFKGLGTLTDADIRAYFGKRVIRFTYDDNTATQLDMVFHQKYAHERKEWLAAYTPESYIPLREVCPISQYTHHELIKFSFNDCQRNIPHVIDGLKISQRKVLFAMFKRRLLSTDSSMKVMQLGGYVAEVSNYHHGEQCLFDTITRMTHGFVGTQNIPLLVPDGQFGTRNHGGKDCASARYIFTKLHAYTPLLFSKLDEPLLKDQYDDNQKVEPTYYVPLLPLLLVNGCHTAIGTGWSSSVPCFNPTEILHHVRHWIRDHERGVEYLFPELVPWYRGFTGTIEKVDDKKYMTTGRLSTTEKRGVTTYTVHELPLGTWTDRYKAFLYDLREKKIVKDVKNYSTTETVHFEFRACTPDPALDVTTLKLTSFLYTSNMVAFDCNGMLRRYDRLHDILTAFCVERYAVYVQQKDYLLREMERRRVLLRNKRRFIDCIITRKIVLHTHEDDDVTQQLIRMAFDTDNDSYTYLLNLPVHSMSKTKVRDLDASIESVEKEIERLHQKSPGDLWMTGLDTIESFIV